MSRRTWHQARDTTRHGRDATLSQVIEAVDRTAPPTKAELADAVGISEQYVSELLQELKRDGVVRKAYVVDDAAVFDAADTVSEFFEPATARENGHRATGADRGTAVLELLERLDDVTSTQYEAARLAFVDESPDQPADGLESLANERYFAVLGELKSYTLTTDWPGNRVASDLATIATNLEIVGDRSCFIADVVDRQDTETTGVIEERILDVFEAGSRINDYLVDVLFEGDLDAFDALHAQEETVHRDLDELFELVTAYDPELYGYLVTVTRALERTIYYWVNAAEIAVRLHSGIEADHAMI